MFSRRGLASRIRNFGTLVTLMSLPTVAASQELLTSACPSEALCIGSDSAPRSVDPRYVGSDSLSLTLEPLLFLPLVGFSERGQIMEVVAESIKTPQPDVVEILIREGIRFGLGRAVAADDVVATYRFLRFGSAGLPPSPRRSVLENVKSIDKLSERVVRFQLHEPDAALVANLTFGILPKEALGRPADEVFGSGFESGPFLREKIEEAQWTLKRNVNFTGAPFGGMMPATAKVIFRFFSDSNALLAALERKEVDIVANGLPVDAVLKFKNNPSLGYEVQTTAADNTAFLAFNLRNKIFRDVRVRRAIALAVNREEILKFTLKGFGTLADSFFPEVSAFFMKVESPVRFNLREADMLLDAAGLKDPDGTSGPRPRASFSIQVPLERERIEVAKAIAAQLKKVGFQVTVEVLEFSTFLKRLNSGKAQMWIAPWSGLKDGDQLRSVFHSKYVPPIGTNRSFYVNDRLDELLDKAKKEANGESRRMLYNKAQTVLLSDQACVFLWHGFSHAVVNQSVSGFKLFPDGRLQSLTRVTKR